MGQGREAGLEAAHGQPGHGPVPFILKDRIPRLDKGNQVPEKHLREQHAALFPAAVPSACHAIAHNDEHFGHPAFVKQPVRDASRAALINPARFVFPIAVLQVKDRIALCRVKGRGRIHQADLVLSGDGRREIMARHRAVGDSLQTAPLVLSRNGNVQEIHRSAAPIADGQIRAEHVAPVDLQEKILKAAAQIDVALPHIVGNTGERVHGAELIQRHFLRAGGFQADAHTAVLKVFISLVSVPGGFAPIRVK